MAKPTQRTRGLRAVIVSCLLLPIAVSSGNMSAHNATGNASWHTATWAPFLTTAGLSTPGPAKSPYSALVIDGLGQVQALHVETFDVPDALTLETKGFSISMRAAGWQSIGADIPPGAWPAGAAGPLRLVVFAATSQMMSDAEQAGMTLSALAVDFGPSMTFKKRVTIRLPLEANAVAPPPGVEHAVHYYHANAKRWQKRKHRSQTANYALGVVPGETLSFSPYCSLRVRAASAGPRCLYAVWPCIEHGCLMSFQVEMPQMCGGGCIAGATIGGLLAAAFLASLAYCTHGYLSEFKMSGS